MIRPAPLFQYALRIACVVAGLAIGAGAPLRGNAALPSAHFVILKCDDVTSTSLRLTIIVVDAKADADAVQRQLQTGTSFETLARQYSIHPSGVEGGEFGVFAIADLPPEFRSAVEGIQSGGHTQPFVAEQRAVPEGWPEQVPVPGDSVRNVELGLGRSYVAATLPAEDGSTMTELTYPFGLRARVHQTRGLGYIEFTAPWKTSIFRIRPDDPIPESLLDLFPRTGRFIRGVFVGVPGHPNWFVDVDDRVDAVTRLLFVDRKIYGDLPGIPKSH